jgi:uncharacterized protein YndB with AHSA1/START domain
MPVRDVRTDEQALTLTLTARFDAPPERVWQIWENPRQLERWWGPPTHPATVVDHDLVPGGDVAYFMTGPDGEKYHGWWRVVAVEAPHRLEFEDGFADAAGKPDPNLPVTLCRVRLVAEDAGTVMTLESRYASAEAMQQVLDMGAVEGMTQALDQVDALLSGVPGSQRSIQ